MARQIPGLPDITLYNAFMMGLNHVRLRDALDALPMGGITTGRLFTLAANEYASHDEAAATTPRNISCLLGGASTPGPAGHPWQHPQAVAAAVSAGCEPRLKWSQ
ncbi:hypothetical protein QYE76_058740 [Lolium multiflorum]|uniref:Uncharacterized protein n=1 Tax=Lolium multiflorum TaxID=4521 RepID=A0AAD8T7D5_LOLMU|nr:hypothetical protein QYE76_058740 [Lolium multiflorum]